MTNNVKQKPEYTWDHAGHAHIVSPRLIAERKKKKGEINEFDPETSPSIYIFDAHGRHVLVNRAGFEARDKSKWFATLADAMVAKEKALDEKMASLAKRKKAVEEAQKVQELEKKFKDQDTEDKHNSKE